MRKASKSSSLLEGRVRLERTPEGIARIAGPALDDAHFGLGFCHARDRGLQILLMRILGRGQACELLQDSDEMLQLDRFFRRWNFGGDAPSEAAALTPRARSAVAAYCNGVNACFATHAVPWELRWLGCRFEPWTIRDVFLIAKLSGFIGLAQSQGEMERFIVECVQNHVSRQQLEELFPGQLQGLDEDLVRRVSLEEKLVPDPIKWASALPRIMASNNWAVAGAKTASGKPIFCNDPHLEINRLPPVWYEAILSWDHGQSYAIGATLPGVPGVILGRNRHLAWGVTYAFMDCLDSWIEDCRDGKYRRDGWHPFSQRKEVVLRKRHPPEEITFYENTHGALEGDPHVPGFYLATRWSSGENTSAQALDAACGILTARTVPEGQALLGQLSNASWNWVLADRDGNIGYQMSGRMPRRPNGFSGLVPLPGWDPANDWQGFEPAENLPQLFNPACGFIATANHDLNALGRVRPINLPMASYRAQRLEAVLSRAQKATVDDMKRLQLDFLSLQAEAFITILKPLLPEFPGPASALLRDWDFIYSGDSKAAFVFEQFYHALFQEVFGSSSALGPEVLDRLCQETGLFFDFYGSFDRVMLSERSAWFGPRTRTEIYRAALAKALSVPVRPYGQTRRIALRHLLFGGKLPRWFGFDREIELPGGRATIHQAQIFRTHGRETTFAPSLRLVTDLAEDQVHLSLAGGVCDRPFSRLYANRLPQWLRGQYATLTSGETPYW